MKNKENDTRKSEKDLIQAILSLESIEESREFFEDLCTPAEFEAMADRWLVVQKLSKGLSYREIAKETGVSVTTVTRVARCLNRENSGYKKIYERVLK
ncbi:MAG: YerC/YecD family TrpR-related protein [Pseudomonadota bacterium]